MRVLFVVLLAFALPSSAEEEKCTTLDTIPNVVTNDIKAGIEKHIEDVIQSKRRFLSPSPLKART